MSPATTRGADGSEWARVRLFGRRWEAEMARGLLETEGVPAWLASDDADGVGHPGSVDRGYPLLVPAERLDDARAALEAGTSAADAAATESVLTALLVELCALPCVTGEEGPIADWFGERYAGRGEPLRRVGHSLVVGEEDAGRPNLLLVGHLDVVPPTDADREPRVEGDRVVGRGTSDMKGGLAVAMDCFEDEALRAGPYNLLLVAYAGEEGGHAGNELAPLLEAVPELRDADLAVVLEPTDLAVQLGCLGGLQAEVTVRGRAAHSARPWHGENALSKAGALLAELHSRQPDDVTVDGLVYREVVTATAAWTGDPRAAGAARNVVPDRFTVNLNYRFAPDKTLEEAEARLVALVGDRGDVVVVDRAPPGRPHRDAALVAAFTDRVDAPVEAKQAWTDVARFSEVGVPALNFGPGLTAQAHQAGEHVPIGNLVAARVRLAGFLRGDRA